MCHFRRSLAFALGLQLLLLSQTPPASAQVISRLKERKANKEQDSPSRAVQPSAPGINQGPAPENAEAGLATERSRIKPSPLANSPFPSARPIAKQATTAAKSDQLTASGTIPHITIETAGPAEVNLGRRTQYTITVRNESDAPAHGLVVHVALPGGAELVDTVPQPDSSADLLEYRLGDLGGETSTKLLIDLIPRRQGSLDIKTHATVSTTASAVTQVRCPEMVVKLSAPAEAIVGDVVKFKATITNTGDGSAENLSIAQTFPMPRGDSEMILTDAVLGQVRSRVERLQPGQTEEIELPAVAAASGIMRASITVKAADGLETHAAAEVRVRQPVIEIKTIGPESRPVQRSGGYVILLSNSGDVAAEGLVINAVIPPGLEVIGIEKRTTFDKKLNSLTWNLPQLATGATESLKFQLKAIEEGEQKIEVKAVGERKLTAAAAHVVQVTGKADLSLVVVDSPGPIEVGGHATYEVRVKNCGSKVVQNISVRCNLPRGIEIEPSPEFKSNGLTLDFTAIESLDVGEEKVLQLSVIGREAGDQAIRFTLECDILSREITAETSTFFFKAEK